MLKCSGEGTKAPVEGGDPGRSSKAQGQAVVQGRGSAINRWSAIATVREGGLTTGNRGTWGH